MARLTPLFSKLFLPYVTVALGTVVVLLIVIGSAFRAAELERIEQSLQARAQLVLPHIPLDFEQTPRDQLDSLLRTCSRAGLFRLTLVDAEGDVLAETDTLQNAIPNLINRPEMLKAFVGEVGAVIRKDPVLNITYSFVAVPVLRDGRVVGVLRAGEAVAATRWELLKQTTGLVSISLALIGFGIALIFLVVRRVSRPLKVLQAGAVRFSQGRLDSRLEEPDTTELASLARALNHMAAQLDDRIHDVERQREEREAVLTAMQEGVLAVDRDGQVIMMNAAVARLFEVDARKSQGRAIEEVVRNTDIHRFVELTLATRIPVEREIIRYDQQERILQLRGTPILDNATVVGVVVVINDVTQMRRLETTRREFVANASHELKTPVTAIKGAIETLREGAIETPADAERFLGIIARQADYLQSIIEDLLSLARIEQITETQKLAAEPQSIRALLTEAIEATCTVAEARGQQVTLVCPEELRGNINGFLIRQAVINLLDNACKYSPEGTPVEVRARGDGGSLIISVEDRGPGIAERHLPRIFERFYRVEASRNRKYGGTGLGLAIVKHAALAHGGTADVDTQLGRGSIFSIRLPLQR